MNVQDLTYAGTFLVLLAGAAGTFYAIFTTSNQKQAIASWREVANAAETRNGQLDEEVSELKTRLSHTEELLTAAQADIVSLRELVTGKAQVEELSKLVKTQHQETMATLLALAAK